MQCGRDTNTMKWWSVTLMPIGGSKTWVLVWKCRSFVLEKNIISMSGIDWLVDSFFMWLEFFLCDFLFVCLFVSWTYDFTVCCLTLVFLDPPWPAARVVNRQTPRSCLQSGDEVACSTWIRDCPSDSGVCHRCSARQEKDREGMGGGIQMR